jgi:uncharacterized membrane protein HdeD (DUF308 family)
VNPDVALVTGLFVLILGIVSAVSAFSDGHRPTVALVLAAIAGVLILHAVTTRPGGYPLDDIPNALLRVIGMVI